MNIQLTITTEEHAELVRRATAAGIDLSSYLQSELHDILAHNQDLPDDQWNAEFRRWLSSHPSRNPNFDDSRESIYN